MNIGIEKLKRIATRVSCLKFIILIFLVKLLKEIVEAGTIFDSIEIEKHDEK